MSRNNANGRTGNVVTSMWRRVRQEAAARLQPAADQGIPLARKAGAEAKRQADKTRSWAAPHLERAGQAVQESIAPRVSSLLSAAARRLEPATPRRPRWPKLIGASAVTAAASAAAAAMRSHMKAGAATVPDQAQAGGTAPATATVAATELGNGQRSAGSDVNQNAEVPTS
jgi:hypothetical protein